MGERVMIEQWKRNEQRNRRISESLGDTERVGPNFLIALILMALMVISLKNTDKLIGNLSDNSIVSRVMG